MHCDSPYCGRDVSKASKHNLWEPYCSRYCKLYHRSGRTYDGRLTNTHILIFEALREQKSFLSRTHLAKHLNKTRATINESVLNMERYGWIKDTSIEDNGERKAVKLTKEGKAYCKDGVPEHKREPITAPCDGCAGGRATMHWEDPRKANQTFCSCECYYTNVCGSARKGSRNYLVLKILRAKGPITARDLGYELERFNTRGTSIRVANILRLYTRGQAVYKEEHAANKHPNMYFWTGKKEMHQLFHP